MGIRTFAGISVAAFGATAALAQVTNVNSITEELRFFNDHPTSTLNVTNNFPSALTVTESNFGAGGFANRHNFRYAVNGAPYQLGNAEGFDVSFTFNMDVGVTSPTPQFPGRKEAGMWFDGPGDFDEAFFIFSYDGESAAFGGVLPFFSFGGDAYTPGDDGTMRMIYRPGAVATVEYILNGTSSGEIAMGNPDNGFLTGTTFGVYTQYSPYDDVPSDFASTTFSNFSLVPEPSALALLAIGGAALLRGRRS